MTSEIEIVCLIDSEDEDLSKTQQVPSPDDWCPKIESVYSEARNDSPPTPDSSLSLPPSGSRSTDEVIDLLHLDNNLHVSIQDCEGRNDEEFSDEDIKKEMTEGILEALDEAKKSGKELLDLKTQYTKLYETVTASLPDKIELCKTSLKDAFSQFYGVTDINEFLDETTNFSEFLDEAQIVESNVWSQSGSQQEQEQGSQQQLTGCGGAASSQTGDILFNPKFNSFSLHGEQGHQTSNLHGPLFNTSTQCDVDSFDQNSRLPYYHEIGSYYKVSIPEEKVDQYIKSIEPVITCDDQLIHHEDKLEQVLDVKHDQSSLDKEYRLDESFSDINERKVDQPCQDIEKNDPDDFFPNIKDTENQSDPDSEEDDRDKSRDFYPGAKEDNIDKFRPDNPLVNFNINDSMGDNCSLKPLPQQMQSGKGKKRGLRGTRSRKPVQDLRSVFARQKVEDGACSDSSDGMQQEDPDYICNESDVSDDEEMWPPPKSKKCLASRMTMKGRKVSSGREVPYSQEDLVKKLENDLKECKEDIKNLEESEIDLSDEKNSTYVLLGRQREKYVAIRKELAKARKIPIKLCRKSDKFRFRGSSFPLINKKVEEFVNGNGFPNFKEIHTLLEVMNSDENFFPKTELRAQAEKIFKSVGEKLKSRRIADDEQVMLSYLVHSDGSEMDDPANKDVQLEQELQKNLELAKRTNVEAWGDLEDSLVGEEPDSEYSSGDEESDSADCVSDMEEDKEYDNADNMSDMEDNEEYDSTDLSDIDENEDAEQSDSFKTMSDEDDHQDDAREALRKPRVLLIRMQSV